MSATTAPPPVRTRKIVTCRGCNARIWFGITEHDNAIPLDEHKTTIALVGDDGKHVRLVQGHVPHHITCPNRDQFRGRTPRRDNDTPRE